MSICVLWASSLHLDKINTFLGSCKSGYNIIHRCKSCSLSPSFHRSLQDACDCIDIWGGHCADFNLWPQQCLPAAVPNIKGTLLQPQMLHFVSAIEGEPRNFTVHPGGEQLDYSDLTVTKSNASGVRCFLPRPFTVMISWSRCFALFNIRKIMPLLTQHGTQLLVQPVVMAPASTD